VTFETIIEPLRLTKEGERKAAVRDAGLNLFGLRAVSEPAFMRRFTVRFEEIAP
jgi:hypothetical protein